MQRPGRGGDLGADVLSLPPHLDPLRTPPGYYVLLLRVGDRPRVGMLVVSSLSDCSCLAALPVAAPCPQHGGCFSCRELDESSGRVAAVVQVTLGRGGARMSGLAHGLRSALPFCTSHLDRTFRDVQVGHSPSHLPQQIPYTT